MSTDNFFTWLDTANKYAPALQRYEKLEIEIKQLTGFSLEALRDLFAMGYTLRRPEYDLTLSELARIIEKYD